MEGRIHPVPDLTEEHVSKASDQDDARSPVNFNIAKSNP